MRDLLQLIQPREGLSHLPGDLNTTNAITSGVLALLEDSLHPGNNVTAIPNQVTEGNREDLTLSFLFCDHVYSFGTGRTLV